MPVLQFKGKTAVQDYHHVVPHHTLVPDEKLSLGKPNLEGNLIIEGDNLLALKALLPTHAGRIKCIYIDPPYNTGNEGWIYNDNLTQPLFKEWLGKVVGKEGEDGTRHDKWCCMMYPRLQLLRELLRDDGVIFVSIDDNEVHHLRMVMDEVFFAHNFVSQISWQSRESIQNDTDISVNHEHVIVYAKERRQADRRLKRTNIDRWYSLAGFAAYPLALDPGKFSNPDNDPRGDWKDDPFDAPNVRENLTYEIMNPKTKEGHWPPEGRCWRTEEPKYKELLADERIVFGKTGDTGPKLKVFYEEVKDFGAVENTWFSGKEYGTATEATKELQRIFDGRSPFQTPKPTRLVKALLRLATRDQDIVLDSFAGSGTTGQAVLELNVEDGGGRKFAMVQAESDGVADPEGHICRDITAERIRRLMNGYRYSPRGKKPVVVEGLGTGGEFTYLRLGPPMFDIHKNFTDTPPNYEELARYIFYTETSCLLDAAIMDRSVGLIGTDKNTNYYLLYDPNGKEDMILDKEFLERVKGDKNRKVVYAEKIWVHREDLKEYAKDHGEVRPMQIPFGLK